MVFCLVLGWKWVGLPAGEFKGEIREFACLHTKVTLHIPAASGSVKPPEELADLAEAAIRRADRLFSPNGGESDVRRLNQAQPGEWVEVDPLTIAVVEEALKWHRLTRGVFDPTIGPIKRLFRFEGGELPAWPSAEELEAGKSLTGADKLRVDAGANRLAFPIAGMSLDLGGIAKGFAVDMAAGILREHGVKNALVNAGGEIQALGINPESAPPGPWQVGIADPQGREIRYLAEIEDRAAATSGNYRSYFTHGGRRYSHAIDPGSGLPVADRPVGVTVSLSGSGAAADALATAFSIFSLEEAEDFIRRHAGDEFNQGLDVVIFFELPDGNLETAHFSVRPGGLLTITRP
jgi:thiamine biosynthesis lipoprotein